MDTGLDTGDILCQRELFFDEEKETFASTYDRLLEAAKELFQENWEAIKEGRLHPGKQGEGTYHKMRDLEEVRRQTPFEWSDQIADFKRRYGERSL